ncbi:enoyl-CoA hydratase-related protein [Schinkia azotoformans]|uniref:enoyl-CoA hydratase/isomerase family protein n=1 Tax=Schinkia azotoformans TaxID=1454 RepID=UPI002DBD07D6|nr:enoyl-CoA hydratase-related protein [Schinkia azotoformans]MEC1714614.1 enoyl-CoA hydratase-related protein [Schinkia azotoformans]
MLKEVKRKFVTYEINEFIYTLTIDNPPLNVLTDELLSEIDDVINEILVQPICRVLIIRGNGEKAFVAGADINQFPTLNEESGKHLVEKGKEIFDKLENAPFPVICAINGFALGGGLELALACDIRIVEQKAKLGLPETGLGILPGYGGTQRLSRLIGPGKAKKMMFTGAAISAEEAINYGLVEEVVPNGESYEASVRLAKQIVNNAPLSISNVKAVVNRGLDVSLAEGQELETKYFVSLCLTQDMKEGVKAFMEKRKADFSGR